MSLIQLPTVVNGGTEIDAAHPPALDINFRTTTMTDSGGNRSRYMLFLLDD